MSNADEPADASPESAPTEADEAEDTDETWPVLSALDLEVCLTESAIPGAAHPRSAARR